MNITQKYWQTASDESIRKTIENLVENGIQVFLVKDRAEARKKVIEFIPRKSEVMAMTSVTLNKLGIDDLVNKGEEYESVRNILNNPSIQKIEKMRIWAAHEWAIGSVHAVTEDGKVVIASATGSQIPSYAYGATNVLWVVGSQKIVKNLDDAIERIHKYAFPLENERSLQAYGVGSGVNKLLIVNKEVAPGRIHIILVKEALGF